MESKITSFHEGSRLHKVFISISKYLLNSKILLEILTMKYNIKGDASPYPPSSPRNMLHPCCHCNCLINEQHNSLYWTSLPLPVSFVFVLGMYRVENLGHVRLISCTQSSEMRGIILYSVLIVHSIAMID